MILALCKDLTPGVDSRTICVLRPISVTELHISTYSLTHVTSNCFKHQLEIIGFYARSVSAKLSSLKFSAACCFRT